MEKLKKRKEKIESHSEKIFICGEIKEKKILSPILQETEEKPPSVEKSKALFSLKVKLFEEK